MKKKFKLDDNKSKAEVAEQSKPLSKTNGEAIRSAAAIENYFKKDFIALLAWKRSYEFPLERENGCPVVYMKNLTSWLKTLGLVDFSHVTSEFLRDFFDTKRRLAEIENIPDESLNSINDIVALTGRPADVIIAWCRDFPDNCPVEKSGGRIVCRSARELMRFLFDHRIPTNLSGKNREDFPR